MNCTAAGAMNCAVLALPDSVVRNLEKLLFNAGGRFASCGAIMGGRLKDAKMVRESRRAKRAYEILGIAAAGEDDGPPNILAN